MKVQIRTIYNVPLTNAGQEYSQTFLTEAAGYLVQCRSLNDIQIAFISGDSGTTYLTIAAGSAYNENVGIIGKNIIYMQSQTAGVVVEILVYN